MRLRILITVLSSISLFLLMVPTLLPQETIEASPLLQALPSLQGVNVYFTEANEEASRFNQLETGLSRFAGLLRRQGANLYTLEWRTRFPTDADLIIVAGPLTDFSPDQTARLWAYMNNGGKLLLLTNPVVETTRRAAWLSTGGLFSLMWSDFNTRARNDVVLTESLDTPEAESTAEPETDAGAPVTTFAVSNLNPDHPITASLTEPLMFFTPRSVEFDASPRDYAITPLVTTDSNFYGENQFGDYLDTQAIEYNIGAEAAGGDTARGQLTLAVVIENPNSGMRVVLIGDREVATNGGGFDTSPAGSASFLHPDNVRFMMNAVSWLVDAEIVDYTFPTPGPSATASITPSPTPSPSPTPDVTPTPTPEA
jgi:hypothetical protein